MNPIKAHLLDRLRPTVQPMTETEYLPLALRTWAAPLRGTPAGVAYLQLGLLSELGEVAAVLKRMLRDDTPLSVAQDRFEDEYGDVLWYDAVLRWEQAQEGFDADTQTHIANTPFDEILGSLLGMAGMCRLNTDPELESRARAANIAKLASRAERGVIQGSGGEQ